MVPNILYRMIDNYNNVVMAFFQVANRDMNFVSNTHYDAMIVPNTIPKADFAKEYCKLISISVPTNSQSN